MGRIVRVVEIMLRVDTGFPSIDAWPVGAVVVRLQPLAGEQLRVGYQEVEFQPTLVLVLDPGTTVLIRVEPGQQRGFEVGHEPIFCFRRQIEFLERQQTGRVFAGIRTGVDELLHLLRIAAQHLGLFPLAIPAQQVIDRASAAALAPGMNLDDHPRAATLSRSSSLWMADSLARTSTRSMGFHCSLLTSRAIWLTLLPRPASWRSSAGSMRKTRWA